MINILYLKTRRICYGIFKKILYTELMRNRIITQFNAGDFKVAYLKFIRTSIFNVFIKYCKSVI